MEVERKRKRNSTASATRKANALGSKDRRDEEIRPAIKVTLETYEQWRKLQGRGRVQSDDRFASILLKLFEANLALALSLQLEDKPSRGRRRDGSPPHDTSAELEDSFSSIPDFKVESDEEMVNISINNQTGDLEEDYLESGDPHGNLSGDQHGNLSHDPSEMTHDPLGAQVLRSHDQETSHDQNQLSHDAVCHKATYLAVGLPGDQPTHLSGDNQTIPPDPSCDQPSGKSHNANDVYSVVAIKEEPVEQNYEVVPSANPSACSDPIGSAGIMSHDQLSAISGSQHFVCEMCGSYFISSAALASHIQISHGSVGGMSNSGSLLDAVDRPIEDYKVEHTAAGPEMGPSTSYHEMDSLGGHDFQEDVPLDIGELAAKHKDSKKCGKKKSDPSKAHMCKQKDSPLAAPAGKTKARQKYNRISNQHRQEIIDAFESEDQDYLEIAVARGVKKTTARSIVITYLQQNRRETLPRGGAVNIKVDEEMKTVMKQILEENPRRTLEQMNVMLRERLPDKPLISTTTLARSLGLRGQRRSLKGFARVYKAYKCLPKVYL